MRRGTRDWWRFRRSTLSVLREPHRGIARPAGEATKCEATKCTHATHCSPRPPYIARKNPEISSAGARFVKLAGGLRATATRNHVGTGMQIRTITGGDAAISRSGFSARRPARACPRAASLFVGAFYYRALLSIPGDSLRLSSNCWQWCDVYLLWWKTFQTRLDLISDKCTRYRSPDCYCYLSPYDRSIVSRNLGIARNDAPRRLDMLISSRPKCRQDWNADLSD